MIINPRSILFFIRYGFTQNKDYVLVVTGSNSLKSDKATEIVQKFCPDPRLRSYNALERGRELVFELQLSDPKIDSAELLIDALKNLNGVEDVSLLAPQLALPL